MVHSVPGVLLKRWERFEGAREGGGLSPASVQRSRGRCAQCVVKGVCVVFQILARRGSWGAGRPGPRGCGSTRRCDRGQPVLPAMLSVCLCLAAAPPSHSALVPSFSGRTAGRRHMAAPPTVPQQRCFLLSFSARGSRLRGDGHAPGYRSMFKALFKSQDLT